MNETPKNKPGRRFLRWLFLIVSAVALFFSGSELLFNFAPFIHKRSFYELSNFVAAIFLACLFWPLIRRIIVWLVLLIALARCFFRWLFTWRTARRAFIGLAILATLVAIFYTEEDWRGKRAWENCKRELEAKGEVLDWDAYIPAPVPDDQNFFKAPKMADWFQWNALKSSNTPQVIPPDTNELTRDLDLNKLMAQHQSLKTPLTIAELVIMPETTIAGETNVIFRFDDPTARERAKELIQNTTGPSANGSQGFIFTAKRLDQIQPAHIVLQADKPLSTEEVAAFFPTGTISTSVGNLLVKSGAEAGSFRILLVPNSVFSAEEFLKWSDQAVPDFDLIREALKRPYAQMDGDYSNPPYLVPISYFVMMRALAQTLASRGQCYLLLGQPAKALREFTLIKDSCRLLEGKPTTLVAAMINVAIGGLYAATISDGFRLHAWREPQLAALQEQLADVNLTPFVFDALQEERAALCRDAVTRPIIQSMNGGSAPTGLGKIVSWFWPCGWTYQNMVNLAMLDSKMLDGFDLAHDTVAPRKFDEATREVEKFVSHGRSPYKILAAIAIPNFTKAEQTTAHNQTLVNEAQIVCALERYRLAHGEYPETLDALAPQFIETIPHDIIGGQPLIYRPTADGKFLLYSVGWNGTDDGGKSGGADFTRGDWVWKS